MTFQELFPNRKPLIACVHLHALPGSPGYHGDLRKVTDKALAEAELFRKYGADGLIVENFRDHPFFPGALPPETIAAMAVITAAVKKSFGGPVGVNALRNDAAGAIAIAVAAEADFIRVNIHTGAALTDQGIIEGRAFETLRKRKELGSPALIFADVRVKHATPLGSFTLEEEVKDVTERGCADAVIVSGTATGSPVATDHLQTVRNSTAAPVLIGSGTTPDNLATLAGMADGFIVGSWFKKDGKAGNYADELRIKQFTTIFDEIISNP